MTYWRDHAACRGHDPELWHPIGTGPDARPGAHAALTICGRCPVLVECRDEAEASGVRTGIWGGQWLDVRPRSRRCGTTSGYQAHVERREAPCDPCRDAHAAYRRRLREAAREAS